GQRDPGTDAAHPEQRTEELLLLHGGKAEQHVRVLAHDQVRVQEDLLAGVGQPEERRHRRLQLVADAAALDQHVRRHLARETAPERPDHRSAATAGRPARRRWWPWHSAAASASAASGAGWPERPRSDTTMCCTCALVAAP